MPYEKHGEKPGVELGLAKPHPRYLTANLFFHSPSFQLLELLGVLPAPAGTRSKTLLPVA